MIELPIAQGARVRIGTAEGAIAEPAASLPVLDLGNVPGASVPVRAGYRADDTTVRVVCATAPARGWAPGIEELVMGRVSQLAHGALGGEVTRFEAAEIVAIPPRFEQRFEARVQRGAEALTARGRHLLGFAGEAHEAVVCSVVCTEPEGRAGCAALVDAAGPAGTWVEAPSPSLLVQGILMAAERPPLAVGIVGALALALAALVIARRPRPRA
ncbi:Hypothetical protein A7982_09762 [Minicystis rosea]|nr:Hypothetical protein A7982_09762 [Minicystis rosea]